MPYDWETDFFKPMDEVLKARKKEKTMWQVISSFITLGALLFILWRLTSILRSDLR
jgi:hypothetical protein